MKTKKTKSQKTFIDLFKIILDGNKENSRKAAREVRKLLYRSPYYDEKFKDINLIVENAPKKYFDISENWRKENFVVAISVLYYLYEKEDLPDFLFPWLFYLLLNKNGNIRQSAVRMIKNNLGALTFHIRCPEYKHSKSKIEQSDFILINLFLSLNDLLGMTWKPKYKKCKYISDLPVSPYKSVQMILDELKYSCGDKYIKHLKSQLLK